MKNINLKSLFAIAFIGYAIITLLNYIESTLYCTISIILKLLDTPYDVLLYIDIFPTILLLIFWAVIVFKYTDSFNGVIDIKKDLTRKYIIRFLVVIIIFMFLATGLGYINNLMITHPSDNFNSSSLIIKSGIIGIINLSTFIIIVIGLFKISRNINFQTN